MLALFPRLCLIALLCLQGLVSPSGRLLALLAGPLERSPLLYQSVR